MFKIIIYRDRIYITASGAIQGAIHKYVYTPYI